MKPKILFLVVILFVITGVIFYLMSVKYSQSKTQTVKQNAPIKATFNCTGGKSIIAEFNNEKVDLALSDQRKIELPQAISASGARFANSDESFVFWNKGDTAFIEENGQTTFTDCLEASPK